MDAYYYSIVHIESKKIIDEGIIRNSEDTIYPQQNTGIEDLPFECEAHHFKEKNYKLIGWPISLSRENCRNLRNGGF